MSAEQKPLAPARRWGRRKKVVVLLAGLLLVWAVGAYLLVPGLWKRYAHRHPGWEDLPGRTYTADGIPADPLNVALVGTKAEVMKIMLAARWYPADPLTLRSCLEIAEASVVRGFQKELEGRNGEGNPWRTDGNLYAGVIKVGSPSVRQGPEARGD